MSLDIVRALQILRPNSEWILQGDNYLDIEWLGDEQNKPTLAQVEATILELPQAQQEAEATKAAEKAAATAKLAALGLTTDDLKALGLGGN